MRNIEQLLNTVKERHKKIVAVACAEDQDVLESIASAVNQGICDAILIGKANKINSLMQEHNINLGGSQIIDIEDKEKAVAKAVVLVKEGKADLVMKGLVDTKVVLKEVLRRENELRGEGLISHVAVFNNPATGKISLLTDAAMNIAPSLAEKKQICENAVAVAHKLGILKPKVAVLSAAEKVNEKMISSVEANQLKEMHLREGWLPGAIVDGPLALDNAVSKKSAEIKGIQSEVAGDADILVVPTIEAGNMVYKTITYLMGSELAGVIVGAKIPVILTSRSDSAASKLYSIALGAILA